MTLATLPDGQPLERPDVDWERHKGTGAPKILPPPGVEWRSASGKTRQRHRYYTRTTTYADAISDQYNLSQWRMRRVALGLGQRPDYVRLASALTDRDDDRDALDELVGKALEAAGPNKADEGTALHALTERIDRGEDLGNPPDELRPDLMAYEVLSGEAFRFVVRECRTVCDELEVAGTPDGLAHVAESCPAGCGPEVLHVVDTKTGSIRYPAKMGIQLAIYAHSERYDPETGARSPLGGGLEVCQRWGAIVHLPVETGRAAPYWLDLETGWRGAELCGPVRAWNAMRADDLLIPFAEVLPVVASRDGTIERGEVRLASHNPKAPTPAPPQELTELPALTSLDEQVAAVARGDDPDAREAEQLAGLDRCAHTDVQLDRRTRTMRCQDCGEWRDRDQRCALSELPASQCACRVHRPDLVNALDPAHEEPIELPPATVAEAILAASNEAELELVVQRYRNVWTIGEANLAAERWRALRGDREYDRHRAAMRNAISSADTLEQLTELMIARRGEAWMTPELFDLADARFWTLRAQPRPVTA